jgi:hypothetical protein
MSHGPDSNTRAAAQRSGQGRAEERIFARLREGWAYDEIPGEERVSAERVRQIVAEVLGKRVIDRGVDHAHLQLERLMPPCVLSARRSAAASSRRSPR